MCRAARESCSCAWNRGLAGSCFSEVWNLPLAVAAPWVVARASSILSRTSTGLGVFSFPVWFKWGLGCSRQLREHLGIHLRWNLA